LEGEREVHLEG